MNTRDLYLKSKVVSADETSEHIRETVTEVKYSTDPRDLKQVAESVPCQKACPANTNIPGYIRCIYEKRYGRAYEINRRYNTLPGVLGRICSRPCEEKCRHGESDLGEPVSICHLKRSAADNKSPMHRIYEELYTPTGKHVAIIGAGPAGLAAAHELSILGHKATIYESMKKPGGMLMYGIPEFRLPRDILTLEIENILRLGVRLKTGVRVGTDITVDQLFETYDAVVTATGCTKARGLSAPGEEFKNVYDGLDFMYRFNTGENLYTGTRTLVIGGGFTAIDCARSSVRLGAEEVIVNIRKTVEFMRIDEQEKLEARYEKIRIYSLVEPVEITGENGKVNGVTFRRTKLEYSNKPPYRIAVPIENSEFTVPADSVIIAIGQTADKTFDSVEKTGSGKNSILEDGDRVNNIYETDRKGYYITGDFLTGATDVITSIANGRKCAHSVDEFLVGKMRKKEVVRMEPVINTDRARSFDFIKKTEMNTLSLEERLKSKTLEVEQGFHENQTHEETKRCYLCNLKYEIDTKRCIYCLACIDVAPRDCIKMIENVDVLEDGALGEYRETSEWNKVVSIAIDSSRCIRCGQCYEICPMNCISVTKTELIELNVEN